METLNLRIKKIKKTEPLIFCNFFNSRNYFWNSGRPEVGNNYFFIFSFFYFFNSRTLILRIKKIKKNGASDFFTFFNSGNSSFEN